MSTPWRPRAEASNAINQKHSENRREQLLRLRCVYELDFLRPDSLYFRCCNGLGKVTAPEGYLIIKENRSPDTSRSSSDQPSYPKEGANPL
ncbi:hypothetical protein EVAR_56251_1 [Eumeta japonica]|uniref:Uncharacterized protein n=1 Tax=Eumeta variegata TaxID=151549 RepID=A0A4C1XHT8_EUMVA|nr:hypothetical protein EVAR_56251_1 [Eumeta japonica]